MAEVRSKTMADIYTSRSVAFGSTCGGTIHILTATGNVPDPVTKKRARRGLRSKAGQERQRLRHEPYRTVMEQLAREKRKEETVVEDIVDYPTDFINFKRDGIAVRKHLQAHYNTDTDQLDMIPRDTSWFVPAVGVHGDSDKHTTHILGRINRVLSKETGRYLENSFRRMNEAGLKYPKAEPNRSLNHAVHLGSWELYARTSRLSNDSIKQKPEVLRIMDEMLDTLKIHVFPRIAEFLKEYCPDDWERRQRAYTRVKGQLMSKLQARPALDYAGIAFCVAVKEGGSETLHVDFNDHRDSLTFMLSIGEYEGAEFCVPQLGVKVPYGPTDILWCRTRELAHCTAPFTGKRLNFTIFCDDYLMRHGLQ
ncbi:hypothetical protein VNI00_018061 [Paramarasmius palmivorus]|uniref:Uncharacterized protein n=1 Tax=Paramarasmius palmivorus TaxID=297713 RepID=A0AAW0B0D5_9AGAR